jgi:hypothetical protein
MIVLKLVETFRLVRDVIAEAIAARKAYFAKYPHHFGVE